MCKPHIHPGLLEKFVLIKQMSVKASLPTYKLQIGLTRQAKFATKCTTARLGITFEIQAVTVSQFVFQAFT